MAVKKKESGSKIDGWHAIALQMIAFPNVPPLEIKQTWFESIAGEKAQESIDKRTEAVYSGPYQDARLRINLDLLRISIALLPPPLDPDDKDSSLVPTLGPFAMAFGKFLDIAVKWLKGDRPQIKRLAFVGNLLQPTKNHDTAYRLISKYLHAVKVDPKSGDLIYRINRRRKTKSGIPGLEINRLSTWRSGTQTIEISQVGSSDESQNVTQESFFCLWDFDINSMGQYKGILPDDKLARLFKELVALATEIAEKGDIK